MFSCVLWDGLAQYKTVELFSQTLTAKSKLRSLLEVLCHSAEFEALPMRRHEELALQSLAKHLPLKISEPRFNGISHIRVILCRPHTLWLPFCRLASLLFLLRFGRSSDQDQCAVAGSLFSTGFDGRCAGRFEYVSADVGMLIVLSRRCPISPFLILSYLLVQHSIIPDATRLLQAMVDVISSNGWLTPALAAMEMSQMVTQVYRSNITKLVHVM